MTKLKDAVKKHSKRLLTKYKDAGLVGVGISNKFKDGKDTGVPAVTLYVEKKKKRIASSKRVELDNELLADVSSMEIDVKEIGKIVALGTSKVRPVQTGCSEGHFRITAGTGSVLVKKLSNSRILRLSNNHVYANSNNANLGDPIYQPGPHDGGTSSDTVGTLEAFHPLDFSSGDNLIDAAVRTTGGDETQNVFGINKVPRKTASASVGMNVVKSGRTTNVTRGKITDVNLTVRVNYGIGDVIFDNQVLVESSTAFSQGGDSGSAVFNDSSFDWVGLLFAGNGSGTYTICTHATDVERLLGVQLFVEDGTEPPPPPPPPTSGTNNWLIVIGVVIAVAIALFFIFR